MWSVVNAALNALFDVLLWPASPLPPAAQAAWLGLPGALLALTVFRYASDQEGIERARDRVVAHLLELRIYRDDFRVGLRAQGALLRASLVYLRHSLVPMAIMITPFLAMLAQVESRFAHRPLDVAEPAVLTVTLDETVRVRDLDAVLVLPAGLVGETPALRIPATHEVVWRIHADRPGTHALGLRLGDAAELERPIHVQTPDTPVAPSAYTGSDPRTLLYPGTPPLPAGRVVRLDLSYPRAAGAFAGLSTASWIFFASSLVLGFALRRPLGVTF